jgi:DNA-directed RNA polymerase subunit RPC12/RpoP
MNLEVIISDYNCPHCGKEAGWSEKLEFEEYNTEEIFDNEKIECACGAKYVIDVTCNVEITLKSAPKVPQNVPIDEGTGLPNVVGDNQISIFDTPSV